MEIEHDILDLIRDLPDEINDASTTTEFKFLTVGSVLWECRAEIIRLRQEVEQLKHDKVRTRTPKSSYLRRVQKDVR
jgi:hypothetical protein